MTPLPAPTPTPAPRPVSHEYDVTANDNYTMIAVVAACSSELGAMEWAMKVGLLAAAMLCPSCSSSMRLAATEKRQRWRCSRKDCRVERSIRSNSIFARSTAPLCKLILLLLYWAFQHPVTTAAEQAEVSPTTAGQWYAYAQGICSEEMQRAELQVGGVGHVVEIDETSLKKKSKYNRGERHPDYWIFGGVDRTTHKWFAKVVFDDRTKPTLSALIKQYIKPGTLIISDMFKSYVTIVANGKNKGKIHSLCNNRYLKGMGYRHLWVNHKKHFRDPKTGAHTNRIEGLWEVKIKQRIKAARGMKKSMVAGYLDECLWRSWFFAGKAKKSHYFQGLIIGIRKKYQV